MLKDELKLQVFGFWFAAVTFALAMASSVVGVVSVFNAHYYFIGSVLGLATLLSIWAVTVSLNGLRPRG